MSPPPPGTGDSEDTSSGSGPEEPPAPGGSDDSSGGPPAAPGSAGTDDETPPATPSEPTIPLDPAIPGGDIGAIDRPSADESEVDSQSDRFSGVIDMATAPEVYAPYIGSIVGAYTNADLQDGWNVYTAVGRSDMLSDLLNVGFYASPLGSLLSSPGLFASVGPLPTSTGPELSPEQVQSLLATLPDSKNSSIDTSEGRIKVDGAVYSKYYFDLDGVAIYLYYSDTAGYWTEFAPPKNLQMPEVGLAATTTAAAAASAPMLTPNASPPSTIVSAAMAASPTIGNDPNSPLNYPIANASPTPSSLAPVAVPRDSGYEESTRTDWTFPTPTPQQPFQPPLFSPITHFDSGNQTVNTLLNKAVFPWVNVLAQLTNWVLISTDFALNPITKLDALDSLLQRALPGDMYDAIQTFPVEGPLLAIPKEEVTLEKAVTKLAEEVLQVLRELHADNRGSLLLNPEGWYSNRPVKPGSVAEQAGNLFNKLVKEAEDLLHAKTALVQMLGNKGLPITPAQEKAASYKPNYAKVLVGNTMEELVNQLAKMLRNPREGFVHEGQAYKIDFSGWGNFTPFTQELTALEDLARHVEDAARIYLRQPNAHIFTYQHPPLFR